MNKLNERQIIQVFQKTLGNRNFVAEDVETFRIGKENVVVKLDTLVESTDIPPKAKPQDIARKSVVSCVSDFAAKGIKPRYGIVSLTLPKNISKLKVQQLATGFKNSAKEFGFNIIGGDTNEGRELVIQVFLIGTSNKIIQRKGAKLNDVIITSGPFGYTAGGLKVLLEKKKSGRSFTKKAIRSVFRPMPKLEFGISNSFTSAMDSSDGLSTTLVEMAKQSKKKFVITNLPAGKDLFEFAAKNRLNPLDLILNGGEEYEIVATVSRKNLHRVRKTAKKLKVPLFEIGFVTSGRGVFLKKERSLIKIKDGGWLHFRG